MESYNKVWAITTKTLIGICQAENSLSATETINNKERLPI